MRSELERWILTERDNGKYVLPIPRLRRITVWPFASIPFRVYFFIFFSFLLTEYIYDDLIRLYNSSESIETSPPIILWIVNNTYDKFHILDGINVAGPLFPHRLCMHTGDYSITDQRLTNILNKFDFNSFFF